MITPAFAQCMARNNQWQNSNLITAADTLDDAARRQNRGAFFDSIEETFSHLLWADLAWMHRLAGDPMPPNGITHSTKMIEDWETFRTERATLDRRIIDWANGLPADWFDGNLSWHSAILGGEITKPRAEPVMHLFNHQTHHRGQIHAMLTAAGAEPGDTDLPFMPDA